MIATKKRKRPQYTRGLSQLRRREILEAKKIRWLNLIKQGKTLQDVATMDGVEREYIRRNLCNEPDYIAEMEKRKQDRKRLENISDDLVINLVDSETYRDALTILKEQHDIAISIRSLHLILKRNNLTSVKPVSVKQLNKDAVNRFFQEGYTVEAIAEGLEIAVKEVNAILVDLKLIKRTPKRKKKDAKQAKT